MPRYFFDVNDGTYVRDNGGTNLPDAGAAQGHALDLVARNTREAIDDDGTSAAVVVIVRDITGASVVTVRQVTDLSGPGRP